MKSLMFVGLNELRFDETDDPQLKDPGDAIVRNLSNGDLSLELDPTTDILAELGRKKGDWLLIGFAAETENLEREARRKLETKNCDMVVANLVGGSEVGFETDQNEISLALRTGEFRPLPRASKRELADRIFDEALKLRLALSAPVRGR